MINVSVKLDPHMCSLTQTFCKVTRLGIYLWMCVGMNFMSGLIEPIKLL